MQTTRSQRPYSRQPSSSPVIRQCLLGLGVALSLHPSMVETCLAQVESPPVQQELCMFTEAGGRFRQVTGRDAVPPEYRTDARCFKATSSSTITTPSLLRPRHQAPFEPLRSPERSGNGGRQEISGPTPSSGATPVGSVQSGNRISGDLAAPADVDLPGSVRRVSMNSSLGPIDLRWPRSVEKLFGRTPERAMADAALTASKALKRKSFPPRVKNLRLNWQVVFMDGDLPEGQIPEYLRKTCHPGWMTPPANIYVVAARVTGQCHGRKAGSVVADADLAQLLVHEIGHAVEYYLTDRPLPREGMRAEGFATWFESFAVDQSSLIPRGSVFQTHRRQALTAMQTRPAPWVFGYTGDDYSRASMYFHGIEDRFGLPALLRVYDLMVQKRMSLLSAASSVLNVKPAEVEQMAARAASSS